MTMVVISAVKRDSLGILLVGVTGAHHQDMHFRVARSYYLSSNLDKVRTLFTFNVPKPVTADGLLQIVIKPTSLSTHAASSTAQSSSSSTSANSSSGSATPAPTVAPKNHSTTQTGPIVGGVVGGVGFVILAAIAFWLWRRRRPVAPNEIGEPLPRHEMAHEKYSIAPPLGEMEGHHTFYGQPLRPSELHG